MRNTTQNILRVPFFSDPESLVDEDQCLITGLVPRRLCKPSDPDVLRFLALIGIMWPGRRARFSLVFDPFETTPEVANLTEDLQGELGGILLGNFDLTLPITL